MADEQEIEGNDLAAVIADEIRQARTTASTTVDDKTYSKRDLSGYYLRGELPDIGVRANGSSLTSRDFSDALSWIHPSVVRVFTSSDQMVQYDKVREENDDWSRDATEYTNYTFLNDSGGYRILFDATHDSLKDGNGLVCSYWEPQRIERKTFRDKTEMEIAALMQEEGDGTDKDSFGWKSLGIEPRPGKPRSEEVEDPITGETFAVELPTMTVKLGKEERPARICDIACKPENLLLNATATTIEGARFVAYLHDDKTRSDLMELAEDYGWDKEVIEELPSFNAPALSEVGTARNGARYINTSSPLKSGDPIALYECFLHADDDDDGIAEPLRAWFGGDPAAGGRLLGKPEDWDDDVPYTDIPCYPIPHQFEAEGLFDRTADIMRAKTVLLRQGADNLYASNLPMQEVEAGSVLNPDILTAPKFGGIIWKKAATAPIVPHVIPYVADKVFAAMQYFDEQLAKRTGVSRTTMALDPEALQNQTATAAQQQRDAGYSQIELIARNMADGWSTFFRKRLKLAVKHQQVMRIPSKRGDPLPPKQMPQGMPPQMSPMGGMPPGMPPQPKPEVSPFRTVDPRQWDPNMAVAINVGLGTGSRDRDMAMLNNVMMTQVAMAEKLAMMGMKAKAVEFIPKILKTAVLMAESSGLKNPAEFYPTFEDEELQQAMAEAQKPQPDPAIELEQLKQQGAAQLSQTDAQVTMQVEQGKNQLAAQQSEVQAQGDIVKNQAELDADLQTKAADRQTAIDLANLNAQIDLQKQERELAWKTWDAEQNRQLEREKMASAAMTAQANNAARADMAKQKPNGKQPGA